MDTEARDRRRREQLGGFGMPLPKFFEIQTLGNAISSVLRGICDIVMTILHILAKKKKRIYIYIYI
jgi:hypothetical protein